RILARCARLTERFSPPLTAPERSSPSSEMIGSLMPNGCATNAFPSAWTTPFVPSVNSHRQPRSRSSCWVFLKNPPPPAGRWFQFRFTRSTPPAPPDFVSDTEGAAFVSTTGPLACGGGGGTEPAGGG